MRGGDGVEFAGRQQLPEPCVAQAAGCLLDTLAGLSARWVGLGFPGNVYAGVMKRQAKRGREFTREVQVAVCFYSAQAVMKMRGVNDKSQLRAARSQSTEQRDGIRPTGEADGNTHAGLDVREVQRELRSKIGHDVMIREFDNRPQGANHSAVTMWNFAGGTGCAAKLYTPHDMQVFVILPAAGLGTRMAGPQPKQFLALDGAPILIHSLRAFAAVERVSAIFVAVRKTEIERVEAQIAEYGFADRVRVVEGGDTRQESVSNALAALPAQADDIVLVHDAVRPLIDAATIERTIDAVAEHGAAIVGLPAVDTIKQVERTAHGALISATIPREYVVLAQTPQGFRCGLLRQAFAEAQADGFVGTDEASVVERAGKPVAVVHGSQVNLKITQPGDLELAEFYLRQRGR